MIPRIHYSAKKQGQESVQDVQWCAGAPPPPLTGLGSHPPAAEKVGHKQPVVVPSPRSGNWSHLAQKSPPDLSFIVPPQGSQQPVSH